MSWGKVIKGYRDAIAKVIDETCREISAVSRYLRQEKMIQAKTTFEKAVEGDKQSFATAKDLLTKEAEKTPIKDISERDWELRKRTGDLKNMKSWNSSDTRKAVNTKLIRYGNEATLNWLVYGSDETIDVNDDPVLSAFMVGVYYSDVVTHDKSLEKWLASRGIKIKPKQVKREVADDLTECVDLIVNELTAKQREAVVKVLYEGKSFAEAGEELKITKKAVYERLYGDERGGGVMKKLRSNPRLIELSKKLR